MESLEKSKEAALSALQQQLESAEIDVSKWGRGQTKKVRTFSNKEHNQKTPLKRGFLV